MIILFDYLFNSSLATIMRMNAMMMMMMMMKGVIMMMIRSTMSIVYVIKLSGYLKVKFLLFHLLIFFIPSFVNLVFLFKILLRFTEGSRLEEELTLTECKTYLRKLELRLSGTKSDCIRRIIEHWRWIFSCNKSSLFPQGNTCVNCVFSFIYDIIVAMMYNYFSSSDEYDVAYLGLSSSIYLV